MSSNVDMFGVLGDNHTDNTAGIRAAISAVGSGILKFNEGIYRISDTLHLPQGIKLIGTYHLGQTGGTKIVQTDNTKDVFTLTDTGSTGYELLANTIQGFFISGGNNQVAANNGGVWCTIKDCTFSSAVNAAIYWKGFIQQWFVEDIEIFNGKYGILYDGLGTGTLCLFDKSTFKNIYINGCSENAINVVLPSGTGQSNHFENITWIFNGKDGIVLGGGISNCTFIGLSTEHNGYSQTTPKFTTGSISASSNSLVVASATGLSNGDILTVEGAGTRGNDLIAAITNIAGTTVTLDSSAVVAVSNVEVTNALYSDFVCKHNDSSTIPNKLNFYSAEVGIGNYTRYSLDTIEQKNTINGWVSNRPIVAMGSIGGNTVAPFRPPDSAYSNFDLNNLITSKGKQTQLVSPPGTDILLGLQANNAGAGTGFGNILVRLANSNRTQIFKIIGETGVASFTGGIAPGCGSIGAFSSCKILSGTGSPEGAVSAYQGSLYMRADGGAGSTLYVKESGNSTTGWVAK